MNRTTQLLARTSRNGVICMRYLQTYRMPLYRLLLSNFELLSQNLKQEGLEILTNDVQKATDDDVTRLYLIYHYGFDFSIQSGDSSLYQFLYYRARKKEMSVTQYIDYLGFQSVQYDFVGMKETQNLSFRDISAITGIPKSTVHRKYKAQIGARV